MRWLSRCLPKISERGERSIARGPCAQFRLLASLLAHQILIEQGIELFTPDFDAVLESRERIFGDAARLIAGLGELDVSSAQFAAAQQRRRQHELTQLLQLRHGQQTIGRARMTRDEDEFTGLRPREVDP